MLLPVRAPFNFFGFCKVITPNELHQRLKNTMVEVEDVNELLGKNPLGLPYDKALPVYTVAKRLVFLARKQYEALNLSTFEADLALKEYDAFLFSGVCYGSDFTFINHKGKEKTGSCFTRVAVEAKIRLDRQKGMVNTGSPDEAQEMDEEVVFLEELSTSTKKAFQATAKEFKDCKGHYISMADVAGFSMKCTSGNAPDGTAISGHLAMFGAVLEFIHTKVPLCWNKLRRSSLAGNMSPPEMRANLFGAIVQFLLDGKDKEVFKDNLPQLTALLERATIRPSASERNSAVGRVAEGVSNAENQEFKDDCGAVALSMYEVFSAALDMNKAKGGKKNKKVDKDAEAAAEADAFASDRMKVGTDELATLLKETGVDEKDISGAANTGKVIQAVGSAKNEDDFRKAIKNIRAKKRKQSKKDKEDGGSGDSMDSEDPPKKKAKKQKKTDEAAVVIDDEEDEEVLDQCGDVMFLTSLREARALHTIAALYKHVAVDLSMEAYILVSEECEGVFPLEKGEDDGVMVVHSLSKKTPLRMHFPGTVCQRSACGSRSIFQEAPIKHFVIPTKEPFGKHSMLAWSVPVGPKPQFTIEYIERTVRVCGKPLAAGIYDAVEFGTADLLKLDARKKDDPMGAIPEVFFKPLDKPIPIMKRVVPAKPPAEEVPAKPPAEAGMEEEEKDKKTEQAADKKKKKEETAAIPPPAATLDLEKEHRWTDIRLRIPFLKQIRDLVEGEKACRKRDPIIDHV